MKKAPQSEEELLRNALELGGKTLQQLADLLNIEVPENQKRAKGWVGELIECCLGATASSLPEPDFQSLGIELKTLPINASGRPAESTFVCSVPLSGNIGESWEDSIVRLKLRRVLWVPIEASAEIPLYQRRVGKAFLWSPDPEQEKVLYSDWREHMDKINMGELDRINAHHGSYLQVRPKALNATARTQTTLESGERGVALPRGFYLRASFTLRIFNNHKS